MNRVKNVLEYLEHATNAHADKTAFSDADSSMTYAEVSRQASSIGSALAHALNTTRRPVAVLIDRNVECLACFLGIVASGNFYVPIGIGQPVERIKTMVAQMQPIAIITVHGNAPRDLAFDELPTVLEYDDLIGAEVDGEALDRIRSQSRDCDPLYAICTSGSTGVPKGVLVSHRSVIDFIPVFVETFGFDGDERFGNQAPFDFDVSVKDIYSTLYCGASMHVIPQSCFIMPKLLGDVLEKQAITTLVWAVSALCVVSGFDAFKNGAPTHVRKILFSGEAMPVKHLNIWRRYYPQALFVNLYGPTEITCNCMYYIVDRDFADDEKLPLGVPFDNEGVYVIDEENRPIGPGGIGEICVTGTCLALGYYRDPERTAASFVQNPLNDSYPELMYRTGDLARLGENGEYVFAARKDNQIKHMGHRIELEELEIHLNAVSGIVRACCLFDDVRNKIVACYEGDASSKEIARELLKKLPKYMVPNIFNNVEALPITKNGKIDRQKLRREFLS